MKLDENIVNVSITNIDNVNKATRGDTTDYAIVAAPATNDAVRATVFVDGVDYYLLGHVEWCEAYGPYTATLEGEEVVLRWNKPGRPNDGSVEYYIHPSGVYDDERYLTEFTPECFATEADCHALFDEFACWFEGEKGGVT